MNIFIYFNIFMNLFDIFKKNNIEDNNIESDIENNIKNKHFISSPFEIKSYSNNYVIVTDLENNYKILNKH